MTAHVTGGPPPPLTDELARMGLVIADDGVSVLPRPSAARAPAEPPVRSAEARQPAPPRGRLTATDLLSSPRAPGSGWRRVVHAVTGGLVNLGVPPEQRREWGLLERIAAPIHGCHRVAVISLKGGVGKTTLAVAIGSVFASVRQDRVIAVDANTYGGNLAERVSRQCCRSLWDLAAARPAPRRYADVRAFGSQSRSRLEALSGGADPRVSAPLAAADYRTGMDVLERFYSLVLTDCPPGVRHPAMPSVLDRVHSVVVAGSGGVEGALAAIATLDWLDAHGHAGLARGAIVALSGVYPTSRRVDVARVGEHVTARCRGLIWIPPDRHLEAGSVIDVGSLRPSTRLAYVYLAAAVADNFSHGPEATVASVGGERGA